MKFEFDGGIKMLTHIGTNTIETERLILRRFEYTDELKKNIIITAVMVCLAVVFSVKFILAGLL